MLQLRIVGTIWLVFGILGAGASLFDLARNVAANASAPAIGSDFIALAFCAVAALAGCGLLRRRQWARVVCGILGVLLLLYAMSFLVMVGLRFGALSLALICAAAGFSVYSVFAPIKYRGAD